MSNLYGRLFCIYIVLTLTAGLSGQGFKRLFEESSFSGQVQADLQYCLKDSVRDNSEYVNKFLSNIYLDGTYNSRMLSVGLRFEMYENPLPGFERAFKGAGIPHLYLTLKLDKLTFTAGDFYEQFGSGLILRTYEERSLGIDNALRGGRITYTPFSWMRIKALAGVQRNRWEWSHSWIKGGDVELDVNDWFPTMTDREQRLQLGGSFISKHQESELIFATANKRLNLPENVGAFSTRLKYQAKSFTLQGEYAWKANDPSADNGYIYRPGQALLLTASYFRQGLGLSVAAKHSDNMSFRSQRTGVKNVLQINYLPAFSRQHTYALAALYPYATQLNGEVAFQGDILYKFKKGSALGGRYGMDFHLNYSQVNALRKSYEGGGDGPLPGTYGYSTSLFRIGNEVYYRDLNMELSRRFNSDLKLTIMYMSQLYNRISEGETGMIRSNIFVGEALYKVSRKVSLRGELQYLSTRQDRKDWGAALIELSLTPHWVFSLTDLYNLGGVDKEHYPLASVAYSIGPHRIQLSGGRRREGYNCAGGVCLYVPATKGVMLSYTSNF